MQEPRAQKIKNGIKLTVFSLTPLVVLYLIASVTSGLIIMRTPVTVTDSLTGESVYTMRIGQLPWSQTSTTPLNALGFPDDPFDPTLEKNGCVHVVFSGDSFTFGDSVDRERNFVSVVRRRTAERYPNRCIRYFNIAERMTTIEQQGARIRETMALLDPDVVILGQYQNDLTDLTMPGSIAHRPPDPSAETNFWGDVLRTSIPGYTNPIVRMLTYRAFALMVTRDVAYEAPLAAWSVLADSSRVDAARELTAIYAELYAGLVDELRRKGIEFGVVILPSKLDVLAKRYPEEAFFVSLAEAHDVPHLSLMGALSSRRDRFTYQMYDGHLNEYGNEVVAEEIMRWLFDAERPPLAALRRAPAKSRSTHDAVTLSPGGPSPRGLTN